MELGTLAPKPDGQSPWSWTYWCERVKSHDLTHMMSDDGGVWSRGHYDRQAIEREAKQFPRKDVVKVWNEQCDLKLVEPYNKQFYWKE